MKKFIKVTASIFATLFVLALVVYTLAHMKTESRRNTPLTVKVPQLVIPTDAASIAEGKRLVDVKGCRDCHGADLAGKLFIDEAPIGHVTGANLTPGKGSAVKGYTDADWIRSIRYGIRPNGKPLVAMPSDEFNALTAEDLGRVISYLKQLQPVDRENDPITLGPLTRVLYLADKFPVLFSVDRIKLDEPPVEKITPEPTARYGKYLAAACIGCHGPGYSGGKIPGLPPSWPKAANLTPTGQVSKYTFEQFKTVLTTGVTPDGRTLNAQYMPWTSTKSMNDTELLALYQFVKELPPRAPETR